MTKSATPYGSASPKCVTWGQFISAMGVLVALGSLLQTWVWAEHVSRPHNGAVTKETHQQFEKRLERFEAIQDARASAQAVVHRRMLDKLDAIQRDLNKRNPR